MRCIVLSLLFGVFTLFAYEKGDALSSGVVEKLQLKEDKIYIIDFFASWCHSCEKEIPQISKLNNTLDTKRFEIVGVDVDKDSSKAEAFQKNMRANEKLNFRVVNDAKSAIIKEFKPIGMPSLYIVKNLKVENMIFGAVDNIDEHIVNILESL